MAQHGYGTSRITESGDEAGSGASGDAEGEPHPHAAARVDWSKSSDSCWPVSPRSVLWNTFPDVSFFCAPEL